MEKKEHNRLTSISCKEDILVLQNQVHYFLLLRAEWRWCNFLIFSPFYAGGHIFFWIKRGMECITDMCDLSLMLGSLHRIINLSV